MSAVPPKQPHKMCKSPKNQANVNYQVKAEKIVINDYETLNTNCTTIGSNNLHLVKKPQQQMMTSLSPVYSNPSPSYPQSPYSSPAGLKSPSPQSMKPPTPQPNSFPVMQIIHNNILTRPMQVAQPQNVIKLKPHLNILPKPSASPQPSPKPSVSPQIVIPTNQQATIVPTAQPLLLNQMPMLTTQGVQFILRPQSKLQPQVQTASPQGLILQQSQPLLQLQPPRSQPLVRVLTNGVQLAQPTTTYVTHLTNPPHSQHNVTPTTVLTTTTMSPSPIRKKPKKKKQKLDLANIMKLSGIGDEDDIQFESDTSQSESEHNLAHSQPSTPQPLHQSQNIIQHSSQQPQQNIVQSQASILQNAESKKMGNIQISAVQQPTLNATTPLVQVLNQTFPGGVIPTSQAQGIPFNPFITPNITINNGLMVQRSTGGFKLTLGEDGRLVLQHDPTLNQDIQSQLLLQSLFGGISGLVLQPSIDQQVHSQTVQTIQQQSVQTIQQQTVQSQTIQTVQQQTVQPHSLQTIQPQIQAVQPQTLQQTVQQTIQHQTVSQPLHNQPMQIVQPQPIQNLNQSIQSQTVHSIQSQVQPSLHSLQNQIQSQIQSQIQGQIQSILQSQLHQQNMAQASQGLNIPQSVSLSQPIVVHSQPMQSIIQSNSVTSHQNLNQNLNVVQSNHSTGQLNLQQNLQQSIQHQQQNIQNIQQSQHQQLNQNFQQQNHVQNVQQNQVQTLHHHQQQQNQIQQSPVQVAQSVQSQGIQTSIQNSQPIQTQPILKVQPFQKSQPPVQTVHPQPAQSMHHQSSQQENHLPNSQPTSYVVNLTPDQLEQLKRNGQVTVNGQTIFMQRNSTKTQESNQNLSDNKSQVKLSPKSNKQVKKVNKVISAKTQVAEGKNTEKHNNHVKEVKSSLITALQTPPKHIVAQNHVQIQPQIQPAQPIVQKTTSQPSAVVQPSVQAGVINQPTKIHAQQQQQPKIQVSPNVQNVQTSQASQTQHQTVSNTNECSTGNHEVERLLGQIIEETTNVNPTHNVNLNNVNLNHNNATPNHSNVTQNHNVSSAPPPNITVSLQSNQMAGPPQRVHTIQLTPQKQQHLKSIQLQIQTLSARLIPGDSDMHNALNLLFQEQQKILASGKLLPPDKVYYHNNQLTIVNPQPLPSQKNEVQTQHNSHAGQNVRSTGTETISSQQGTRENSKACVIPVSEGNIERNNSTVSVLGKQGSGVRVGGNGIVHHHPQNGVVPVTTPQQSQQSKHVPTFTKAQLFEQQMAMDQNEAANPDVHNPFRDKMDACKRLIRYHCYDTKLPSAKELASADEIFEMNAKNLIDKFTIIKNKYKYLRLKESTRNVPTSEVMMLYRMYVNDEQQSLNKLKEEALESPPASSSSSPIPPTASPAIEVTPPAEDESEEYDEWACIQKELSSLQPGHSLAANSEGRAQLHANYHDGSMKRSHGGDSRLESLKRFRVEKHHRKNSSDGPNVQLSAAQYNQQNEQKRNALNSASSPQSVGSSSSPHSVQMSPSYAIQHSQQQLATQAHSMNAQQYVHLQQQNFMGSSQNAHISRQVAHIQSSNHQQRSVQQHYAVQSSSSMLQHVSHTVHHHGAMQHSSVNFSQNSFSNCSSFPNSGQNVGNPASNNTESPGTDNIIDEQVQSAINSILNLQQASLDLDDVNSILS